MLSLALKRCFFIFILLTMNQITLDHCIMALSQTRACFDHGHHIALAVMCGVTFERFTAYDANKKNPTNPFQDPRSYLNKASDWDNQYIKLGNKLLDIRNNAVHAEYAHKFDPQAKEQAQQAWNLLNKIITYLIKSPQRI